MYDKRVHRGNSYAAMVIPAGTNHDTMVMEKKQTQKRTFRSSNPNVSFIFQPNLTSYSNLIRQLISTQIGIFLHLNLSTEESMRLFKLTNMKNTLQTNPLLKKPKLLQSSISIDLLFLSFSQRCRQKKIVKQLKFLMVTMSYLILKKRQSQC